SKNRNASPIVRTFVFIRVNSWLTTSPALRFRRPLLVAEATPLGRRMRDAVNGQVPFVGSLVRQLAQQRAQKIHNPADHNSSAASLVATNGVSFKRGARDPLRIPTHTRIESIRITDTRTM